MAVWWSGNDWFEQHALVLDAEDGVAENGNQYVKLTIERTRNDGSTYEWRTCVFTNGDFVASDVMEAIAQQPLYFCGGMRRGKSLIPTLSTD